MRPALLDAPAVVRLPGVSRPRTMGACSLGVARGSLTSLLGVCLRAGRRRGAGGQRARARWVSGHEAVLATLSGCLNGRQVAAWLRGINVDDERSEVAGSQTSELGSLYAQSRALPRAWGRVPSNTKPQRCPPSRLPKCLR